MQKLRTQEKLSGKIALFVLFCVPTLMFASGSSVSIGESDFFQRTINFVIFVAIVWYFGADTIKGIFANRRSGIALELKNVQEALHQAKKDEEAALRRLEESKDRAKEIVESAKQEANMVQQRYSDMVKRDTQTLSAMLEGSIEFERRRATQEAVNELLSKLLEQDSLKLNKDDYVNIITKRIS